jgi:large subunit ribosomal protein L15
VRLSDLNNLAVTDVDILVLKQAGVLSVVARDVRVILSGEVTTALNLKGLNATAGAKAAIEAAGGSVA